VTPNAIGVAVDLLGDEWSLLVVQQQLLGVHRFTALQRALSIAPAVLSARLTRLVDGGVLRRDGDGYSLTPAGRDLWSLLLCIWAWELRWVQAESLPAMVHRSCGERFAPVQVCAGCGGPAHVQDVRVSLGPTGELSRAVPAGGLRRRPRSGSSDGPGLFPETMALLGSRWSSALLGAAFLGARRFRDFQSQLGAPPAVISDRLRTFVALGVLDESYALTDKGLDAFPVAAQVAAWAQRWHALPEGPALIAVHTPCGGLFVPRLTCDGCGEALNRSDVLIEHQDATRGLVGAPVPSRERRSS
jgi:DNA-binding HxlR family transcriptional regulator